MPVEIFVALVDEAVDVRRPVLAEHLHDNIFRIQDQPYDRDVETWEFGLRQDVECEMIPGYDGPFLAATKLLS